MKNILVIGATGQIGSELTLELRKRYGDDHVVAGYIPSAMPKGELKASGPSAIADVTDRQSIEVVARQFKIDTIYNLAALLSVVAESRPAMAWKIGIDGLWNVLEVAREYNCAVFTPSSIGSFERDPSGWRHYGLCGGYFLLCREGRKIRMSGEGRHVYGYDVYARRTERGHLADGSGTGKAEAPQRFQHRLHEF